MAYRFTGNVRLVCPDCGTHLVGVTSSSERYHCADCDLRLHRDGDEFLLTRFDEVVGRKSLESIELRFSWRPAGVPELAHAV